MYRYVSVHFTGTSDELMMAQIYRMKKAVAVFIRKGGSP